LSGSFCHITWATLKKPNCVGCFLGLSVEIAYNAISFVSSYSAVLTFTGLFEESLQATSNSYNAIE